MNAPMRARLGQTLVIGASGFLGLNLVEGLLGAGVAPRCLHRRRSNTIPLRRLGVERVVGAMDDLPSLVAAIRDVDTVFHLAGHYPRHGRDPEGTIALATAETRNLLDACAEAGVRRLIFVSSTATVAPRRDGQRATDADIYPKAPGIGAYHDAKWHMEALALAEERFEVSIACPGACLGAWDLRVGTSALLVGVARGEPIVWPDGIVNIIDARDLATVLIQLAAVRDRPRRVLIAAHDLRLSQLLPAVARYFGVRPPPPPVPPEVAIAFADAEEARVAGTAERPRLAREIADLVIHGSPLDTRLAAAWLGAPWRPLSATLADFTSFARRMKMLPAALAPPSAENMRAIDAIDLHRHLHAAAFA